MFDKVYLACYSYNKGYSLWKNVIVANVAHANVVTAANFCGGEMAFDKVESKGKVQVGVNQP